MFGAALVQKCYISTEKQCSRYWHFGPDPDSQVRNSGSWIWIEIKLL
jgi:hypothetical protein